MKPHFRPLRDRVLLKRVEVEEKTPAGIIIPDTVKEKPVEGEVLAVGPGAPDDGGKMRPLEVKVGDRVLFGKWSELRRASGSAVPWGGKCGQNRKSLPPPDSSTIFVCGELRALTGVTPERRSGSKLFVLLACRRHR